MTLLSLPNELLVYCISMPWLDCSSLLQLSSTCKPLALSLRSQTAAIKTLFNTPGRAPEVLKEMGAPQLPTGAHSWEPLVREISENPLRLHRGVNASGWYPFSSFAILEDCPSSHMMSSKAHEKKGDFPVFAYPFDFSTFPWTLMFPQLPLASVAVVLKLTANFGMAGGDGSAHAQCLALTRQGQFAACMSNLNEYPSFLDFGLYLGDSLSDIAQAVPRFSRWLPLSGHEAVDRWWLGETASEDGKTPNEAFTFRYVYDENAVSQHSVTGQYPFAPSMAHPPHAYLGDFASQMEREEKNPKQRRVLSITLQEFNELCVAVGVSGSSWSRGATNVEVD